MTPYSIQYWYLNILYSKYNRIGSIFNYFYRMLQKYICSSGSSAITTCLPGRNLFPQTASTAGLILQSHTSRINLHPLCTAINGPHLDLHNVPLHIAFTCTDVSHSKIKAMKTVNLFMVWCYLKTCPGILPLTLGFELVPVFSNGSFFPLVKWYHVNSLDFSQRTLAWRWVGLSHLNWAYE